MSDIAKQAGISRQAVYLHFPSRAELLIATTRYIDQVKDIDGRLAQSRSASTGPERLDAFIEAWGNYIPEIYGVAKALMAMQSKDEAAGQAWADRMNAVRHGCEAAVAALARDGVLTKSLLSHEAVDLLWSQVSVPHWEHLRHLRLVPSAVHRGNATYPAWDIGGLRRRESDSSAWRSYQAALYIASKPA